MTQRATDVFETLECWTGVTSGAARWYEVECYAKRATVFVRNTNCKGRVV